MASPRLTFLFLLSKNSSVSDVLGRALAYIIFVTTIVPTIGKRKFEASTKHKRVPPKGVESALTNPSKSSNTKKTKRTMA